MTIPIHILILEDRAEDAELMLHELRRSGYDAKWSRVETEDDFIAQLDPALDIILADYQMPQFNGLRALEILRQRGLDIPFIIVSGTIGEDSAVEVMKRGATDYLLKDRLARLGLAIDRALEEKRLRDEKRRLTQEHERLQEYNARIVQAMAEGLTLEDPEGILRFCNPALQKMLGYTEAEICGTHWRKFFPPGEYARVAEQTSHRPEMISNAYESILLAKEGREIPVIISAVPLTQDGVYSGTLATYLEITERKQIEKVLHESEDRYRDLVENSQDLICTHDMEGRLLSANLSAARLLGYDLKELIGTNIRDLLVPEVREQFPHYISQLKRDGAAAGLLYVQAKNGERRIWEYNNTVRTEGVAEPMVRGMAHDITERKRAEEVLRLRESYLTAILENQPGLVWLKDVDSRFLTVNQVFADSCGKTSPAELVGKTDLDIWPKELAEKYRADDAGIIKNKTSLVVEEPIFDRGETKWFETFKTPVLDENGDVLGTTGYSRDITERKTSEEALRRSLEQITHGRSTLQALSLATQAAQRAHTPQTIYQAIGDEIKKLGFNLVIYDYDAKKRELSVAFFTFAEGLVRAAETLSGLSVKTFRISVVSGGYHDQILSAGKAILYVDATEIMTELLPPLVRPLASQLISVLGIKKGIYTALVVNDKPQGLLVVLGDDLGEADLPAVDILAAQISIALENAGLYQDALYAAERRTALYRNSQALVRLSQDIEQVYTAAHQAATQLMPAEVFTIVLLDEEHQEIEGAYLFDKGLRAPSQRTSLGKGFSSKVIASGEAIVIRDILETPIEAVHFGTKESSRSLVAVPMRVGDQVFGAISVQSYQTDTYIDEDRYLLEMLAAQVAIAIQNVRLFEQARQEISERKQAEEKLAASESELLAVFAAMHDVVLVIDKEGIYRKIAPTNPSYWYIPPQELIGKRMHDVFPAKQADVFYDVIQQVLDTKQTTQIEYELVVGKQVVWYESSITPMSADLTVWVARDITNRKQRSRELEAIAAVSAASRAAATRAEMLSIILDPLTDLLQADTAAFAMRDIITGETVVEAARGEFGAGLRTRLPAGEGVSGRVINSGKPYLNNDFQNESGFVRSDIIGGITAAACVPLISETAIIGVIWIGRKTPIGNSDVHVLTVIAEIAASAIYRTTLHEEAKKQLERMAALRTIDLVIGSSFDLRVTLDMFLSQVLSQLHVDAAAVLNNNAKTHILEYAAGRGFQTPAIEKTRLHLGEGHAGRAVLERQMIYIPNLTREPLVRSNNLAAEKFVSYHAVPLIAKGEVKGLLEVFHRTLFTPDDSWLDFLETLAGQAAIAMDNATLFDDLQRTNTDLELAYDATIESWSRALDLRDKETEGHSSRVTEMTLRLAAALNVDEKEFIPIRRGALLHDIGKMGIPDSILLKPGPLDDAEWEIMKQHPQYAYEMLSPIAYLRPALDIPHCHHEKWDGTGYPRGLREEQIPLAARLFAVVDVWDAITSDRVYRPAWSREKARAYIREQSGHHFEPGVVKMFLKLIETH